MRVISAYKLVKAKVKWKDKEQRFAVLEQDTQMEIAAASKRFEFVFFDLLAF